MKFDWIKTRQTKYSAYVVLYIAIIMGRRLRRAMPEIWHIAAAPASIPAAASRGQNPFTPHSSHKGISLLIFLLRIVFIFLRLLL
jgi:hypothetical protein